MLVKAKFAVEALPVAAVGGPSNRQKDSVATFVVDAGEEWSHARRGSGCAVVFASFQVDGSRTTIIEICGVRFRPTRGSRPWASFLCNPGRTELGDAPPRDRLGACLAGASQHGFSRG